MRRILPRLRSSSGVPRGAGNGILLVSAIFVVLVATAAVLGAVGLLQLWGDTTPRPSVWALGHSYLGLFTDRDPSWVDPSQDLPTSYQVARFLAPVSTGYVFVTSAAVILSEKWRQLRARLARRHSIVVGGGRRGVLLARSLAGQGAKVVLVDVAASSEGAAASLVRGVIPLAGDPTDTVVLRRAGVERAAEIFAVCDDGEMNASVVLTCRELRAPVAAGFACYAQVDDSNLHASLEARLLSMPHADNFRVSLIDRSQLLARALLSASSPWTADTVLVVGDGLLARAVTAETMRAVHLDGASQAAHASSSPRVVVVGPEAEAVVRASRSLLSSAGYPLPIVRSESVWTFAESASLVEYAKPRQARVLAYVCVSDESDPLKLALSLLRHAPDVVLEVATCLREGSSFAKAFAEGPVRIFDDVRGALRIVAASEVVSDVTRIREASTLERLAEALHDAYVAHMTEHVDVARDPRHVVRWGDLPPALREANRAQAWHVGEKLSGLGLAILPQTASSGAFTFSDDEIETLARSEHVRWMDEKHASGLMHGTTRTPTTHPDLVDWEDLSEEAREKDRVFMRELPEILANEGYAIVRLPR